MSCRIPAEFVKQATANGLPPEEQDAAFYDFDTVDRILCAIGRPDLWREWPLIAFYYSADLRTPDEVNPTYRCRKNCPLEERGITHRSRGAEVYCKRCARARQAKKVAAQMARAA